MLTLIYERKFRRSFKISPFYEKIIDTAEDQKTQARHFQISGNLSIFLNFKGKNTKRVPLSCSTTRARQGTTGT